MAEQSAKLEPFVLLARSTKGAAAAKVINDATAAPGVYAFGELLDLTGIRALENDTNLAKSWLLLQLFAYGTLSTYSANESSYPPLSPAHIIKLKHLTLVSLALQHRALSYDDLLTALRISSVRELEDLIIDVMYAGLLQGKMHHHERILHIDWVSGRDVPPTDLGRLQEQLENWCSTAQHLLTALDERIAEVRISSQQESAASDAYKAFRTEQFMDAQKETKEKKDNRMYGGGGGGGGRGLQDDWLGPRYGGDTTGGAGAGGGGGGSGGQPGWRFGNDPGAVIAEGGRGGRSRGSKRQRD